MVFEESDGYSRDAMQRMKFLSFLRKCLYVTYNNAPGMFQPACSPLGPSLTMTDLNQHPLVRMSFMAIWALYLLDLIVSRQLAADRLEAGFSTCRHNILLATT